MVDPTYICLLDLSAYDKRVAPALRKYQDKFDPSAVVDQLKAIAARPSSLSSEDCKHWIDAIAPDAGYKPSPDTVKELAGMLIDNICVPQKQDIGIFVPYLTEHSDWFADLMDGGEELAGGRLEFTIGSGALYATRQQIHQFLEEVTQAPAPEGNLAEPYANLRKLLASADANPSYTILKTDIPPPPEEHQ